MAGSAYSACGHRPTSRRTDGRHTGLTRDGLPPSLSGQPDRPSSTSIPQDVTVRTVNTVTTSFVIFFGTLFLAALLALGLR